MNIRSIWHRYRQQRRTTTVARAALLILCLCLAAFAANRALVARRYATGDYASYDFFQGSKDSGSLMGPPRGTLWVDSVDEIVRDLESSVLTGGLKRLDISSMGEVGVPGYIWLGDIVIWDSKAERRMEALAATGSTDTLQSEYESLSRLTRFLAPEGAKVRFVSCRSEAPNTRDFLESVFPNVEVVLYERQVGWFMNMTVMRPFWVK